VGLLVLELIRAAEVVARREVRPGARHDDDADRVVVRCRAECLVELEDHHAALGVEHLGRFAVMRSTAPSFS